MKLPRVSGKQAVKVFIQLGYVIDRRRGSHVVLIRAGIHLSVPIHDELAPGTLRALIRDSGITIEEFISRLR
jgi:predicted RNA binding protein YcfA (HicA-like mRNA interferase family)